jgi:hypothetical protein
MRTQDQIEASRINGAKSHGPVTPEGKQISSQNAVRHGLLGKTIVLEGESSERFAEHLDAFNRQFLPKDELECALVEHMAISRWRQLSVWGLETADISDAVRNFVAAAPENLEEEPAVRAVRALSDLTSRHNNLSLYSRYDVRFDRQYYRAYTALMAKRKGEIAERTRQIYP